MFLPTRSFGPGFLPSAIARIARVQVAAAVGPQSVDRIEVQRRRAEVLDRSRVGLLLADRGQIQRDVVIDELAQIREARGDLARCFRRRWPGRRPSSRPRAPEAARHRPRAARGRETFFRTFLDRRARIARRETPASAGGLRCRGRVEAPLAFSATACSSAMRCSLAIAFRGMVCGVPMPLCARRARATKMFRAMNG